MIHGDLPADLIKKVLKKNDEILSLAKELYEEKSLLLMGRGYNYATCLEGALKVKEVIINCWLCGNIGYLSHNYY